MHMERIDLYDAIFHRNSIRKSEMNPLSSDRGFRQESTASFDFHPMEGSAPYEFIMRVRKNPPGGELIATIV